MKQALNRDGSIHSQNSSTEADMQDPQICWIGNHTPLICYQRCIDVISDDTPLICYQQFFDVISDDTKIRMKCEMRRGYASNVWNNLLRLNSEIKVFSYINIKYQITCVIDISSTVTVRKGRSEKWNEGTDRIQMFQIIYSYHQIKIV